MTLGKQDIMYNVIQHAPAHVAAGGLDSVFNSASSILNGKRPLAPAPDFKRSTALGEQQKKTLRYVTCGGLPQASASVARRNARERNRVKQVNNGFATLRQHIPMNILATVERQSSANLQKGANKKLSKVETLRLAVEYIKSLQKMLDEHDCSGLQSNYSERNSDSPEYKFPIILSTPPCSESSSPSPSHSSDASSVYASFYQPETYDNYDSKNNDEELLDAIFMWEDKQ